MLVVDWQRRITSVVCMRALRIREATFSLKKGAYLYLAEAMKWMRIGAGLQLLGLNMLILMTAEIISRFLRMVRWRLINCYLQLLCLAVR